MEIHAAADQLTALAHTGRLELFRHLVKAGSKGTPVGELAILQQAKVTTVSAQLSVLANAHLVSSRRDGRSIIYQANYPEIRKLLAFLMEDCCQGRSEILSPLLRLLKRG